MPRGCKAGLRGRSTRAEVARPDRCCGSSCFAGLSLVHPDQPFLTFLA